MSENKCRAMPSAVRCYLIYSFPSSYNHTFSSMFLHLKLKECFYMFAFVYEDPVTKIISLGKTCLLVATIFSHGDSVANTKSRSV